MAISVQALWERISSQFGRGSGAERLNDDFIYALNDALNELSYVNDLATKLTNIDDVNDTIDDMDDEQFYIVRAGTVFNLMNNGRVPDDPKQAEAKLNRADRAWARAKDDYWTNRVNALNNDSDGDVIGNGYLTQK